MLSHLGQGVSWARRSRILRSLMLNPKILPAALNGDVDGVLEFFVSVPHTTSMACNIDDTLSSGCNRA